MDAFQNLHGESALIFPVVTTREPGEKCLVQTLFFEVTTCEEVGGYIARWDDPAGGGITTQGDSFAELDAMIRDAVEGYFADREKPVTLRLHFVDDPVLAVA